MGSTTLLGLALVSSIVPSLVYGWIPNQHRQQNQRFMWQNFQRGGHAFQQRPRWPQANSQIARYQEPSAMTAMYRQADPPDHLVNAYSQWNPAIMGMLNRGNMPDPPDPPDVPSGPVQLWGQPAPPAYSWDRGPPQSYPLPTAPQVQHQQPAPHPPQPPLQHHQQRHPHHQQQPQPHPQPQTLPPRPQPLPPRPQIRPPQQLKPFHINQVQAGPNPVPAPQSIPMGVAVTAVDQMTRIGQQKRRHCMPSPMTPELCRFNGDGRFKFRLWDVMELTKILPRVPACYRTGRRADCSLYFHARFLWKQDFCRCKSQPGSECVLNDCGDSCTFEYWRGSSRVYCE